MSSERHAVQRHHFANQIVDWRKDFERLPGKLRKPKLMEDSFQPGDQISNGRIVEEQLSSSGSLVESPEFQTVKCPSK